MGKRCFVLTAIAGLAATCLSGCANVGGGGGGQARVIVYRAGELSSTEAATIDKTWLATEKAFKQLQLLGEAKQKDGLAARIEANGAGDKRIIVKLRNQGEKRTEIRIQIGWFGDEGLSRKILDKIRGNL